MTACGAHVVTVSACSAAQGGTRNAQQAIVRIPHADTTLNQPVLDGMLTRFHACIIKSTGWPYLSVVRSDLISMFEAGDTTPQLRWCEVRVARVPVTVTGALLSVFKSTARLDNNKQRHG